MHLYHTFKCENENKIYLKLRNSNLNKKKILKGSVTGGFCLYPSKLQKSLGCFGRNI